MAARVNTRFVIILSVVLVAAMGGVVWAAYMVLSTSGDEHAARALKYEAEGNWRDAEKAWSTAVNHDQTRLDWLASWRNALERVDFPTTAEYVQEYQTYRTILRQTAAVKASDFDAHDEYFKEMSTFLSVSAPSQDALSFVNDETDRLDTLFAGASEDQLARLRRHRGAFIARMIGTGMDLDAEVTDRARADLTAAIGADPADIDSLASLTGLELQLAGAARLAGRASEAQEMTDLLASRVAAFAEANPGSLRARAIDIGLRMDAALQQVEGRQLFGGARVEAQRASLDTFADEARALVEAHMAAGPEWTDAQTTTSLMAVASRALREEAVDAILRMWNHSAQHHPGSVDVLQRRGFFLKQLGRFGEAIEAFGAIADLARPPISAEGVLLVSVQSRARWEQADAAIEQWLVLTPGTPGREDWLERAKGFRTQALDDLSESSAELMLLDAKLAFADNDFAAADRLIRRFNEQTAESTPSALRLAADIAARLGNSGEQRRLLTRAVSLDGTDMRSLLALADVNLRLKNYEESERLLAIAADQRPDLPVIREQLESVRTILGSSTTSDPIQAAMASAQSAADSGDYEGAIAALEGALNGPGGDDSVRLHLPLARLLLATGRFDRAREVIDRGLVIEADNAELQRLRRGADIGNDVEKAVAAIDAMEIPEGQRALRKHTLYLSTGDAEQADRWIAEARRLLPASRDVLLAAFDHALRSNRVDEARAIAADPASADIDGAGGLTLRARINLAENKLEDAERELASAVERGSLNATTLALLGQVQYARGNTAASIDNFRRAIAIKPNDVGITVGYLRALAGSRRTNEALEEARKASGIGRGNPEFRAIWLALEAIAGSKQLAFDERSALAQSNPQDLENTAALIALAIDLRKFDEARVLLDDARAAKDSLTLVALDARWHIAKGDLNTAIRQYADFLISDAPDAESADAYTSFGAFLIERGLVDQGLTTLRQGRRLQDPANPTIDLLLGSELFRLERYGEAAETFAAIADGPARGSPIGGDALLRLTEVHTRAGDFDAAETRLAQAPEELRDGVTARLLAAAIADGRGDSARAKGLIDEAITAHPTAPIAYLRRASMLMKEDALLPDAVEDLTRAIELDPTDLNAYRLRSSCYIRMDRTSEAADDIVKAVQFNPDDVSVRVAAARRLVELGDENRATEVVDDGVKRRPGDLRLLVSAGDMFAQIERHRRALQYYKPAWEQTKDVELASRYVRSLLAMPSPDYRLIQQVVNDSAHDPQNPQILMTRATIEAARKDTAALTQVLTQTYRVVKDNPNDVVVWASQLGELLGGVPQAVAYMDELARTETLTPWGRFAQARVMAQEDAGRAGALTILSGLIDGGTDPQLRLASLRVRSILHYTSKEYGRAADDMVRLLDANPSDAETQNNLAYTLAVHLDRAAEAVPHAEQAAALNPGNRGVLDTLGIAYVKSGQAQRAIAPLQRALELATTDSERAPVLVHLGEARLASGNRSGANDAAQEALRLLTSSENSNPELRAELDALLEQIAGS
jgi:tetratricopeptide (TPR) repeat protein